MTTIAFKRTGGSMDQETAVNLDLNEMPASVSQRIQNLINESNFFEIPLIEASRSGPDEFEYTVTVVAGNSIHTVRATDTEMPKSLRPLIDDLTELAKATT